MTQKLKVTVKGWEDGCPIPSKYAFGMIPEEGHFALGGNISPEIQWNGAPQATKSFILICHDPDVPSVADDVNQEGKKVPEELPRVDFYHWLLVNIPPSVTLIEEGAASVGITPRGKSSGVKEYGEAGLNSYTHWFKDDPEMEGQYADYDGPCPPWNDTIPHHYHFTIYALDLAYISVNEPIEAPEVLQMIKGHVLAQSSYTGTYSMNPSVKA